MEAAIVVFDKAVTAHGVPQRLLSDNGLALNSSRRGYLGQLVVHVMALGVEPITGNPYKPTTQGKNERFTPQAAWQGTEKAEAPRRTGERFVGPATAPRPRTAPVPTDLPEGTRVKKLTSNGTFMLDSVHYMIGGRHGFQQVLVVTDGDTITVADLVGEILIEHTRPAPGITYVGNGRPRGPHPKTSKTSPKS